MLSNDQKALIKRAQREAQIDDEEYRQILFEDLGFGVQSSTDPRLGDRHFDKILAYFEAIFWRKFDAGEIVSRPSKPVFQVRGYWASKNSLKAGTSRERYAQRGLETEIHRLEAQLRAMGCHDAYLRAIQKNTGNGWPYRLALARTVAARSKQQQLA
jgi:hypothetical protein